MSKWIPQDWKGWGCPPNLEGGGRGRRSVPAHEVACCSVLLADT